MKKQQSHINETLLLKVLDNTADEKEMSLFTSWYNATAANAAHFEQLKKVNQLSFIDKNSIQKNWDAIVAKYESGANVPDYIELPDSKNSRGVFTLNALLRIAAVLVILVGISVFIKHIVFNPKQMQIAASDLSKNEAYHLADGSLVYLNENSSISFSEKFGSKNRELVLEGEGFFEVQPNREIPFLIHTNNTTVKVVGTKFNVNADHKQVQIVVVEGVVEFFTGDKENLVKLNANEQGTYNPVTNTIKKEGISDPNSLAWKTGILYFDETPVNHAFELLTNHYSRVMVFENDDDDPLTLTTTFDNQSLEAVLDELTILLNTNYVTRNDTIYFKTNP